MLSNKPKFPLNGREPDGGMVISPDNRSMQRGRRRASRTEVCRPCLVWVPDAPEAPYEGVVLDLNPRGMRIRMLSLFEEGTRLTVQLMRDENFQVPLSQPLTIMVVRALESPDGFVDHGTVLEVAKIKKAGTVRPVRAARPNFNLSTANRMFTAMRRNEGRTGR
jgi:hypothetical protein